MGADESARLHAANLEKVHHVVVTMLENRSFDHVLGYLTLAGRRTHPVHHLDTTALDVDPDRSADAVDEHVVSAVGRRCRHHPFGHAVLVFS
jgi:hypothetical protein